MDENKKLKQKVATLEKENKKLLERLANLYKFFDSEFSNKLINSLPGIFYLYKKVGNDYLLKKWNKNFEINLGYSFEELLDMNALQFLPAKEIKNVSESIAKVFKTGAAKTSAFTLTKTGKQIPYCFEGFKFENQGSSFFMGLGIDISEQKSLKSDLSIAQNEKEQTVKNLDRKRRELVTTALKMSQTNELIKYIQKQIGELLSKHKDKSVYTDLMDIERKLQNKMVSQNSWQIFTNLFHEVHPNFFQKLKDKHPDLSKTELRFCAYLKIHLSSSQILSVLNVSYEGVRKTRYRIRKKMELNSKDSLEDYIAQY
ncbi:MAG: hypothetical protein DRJ10_04675 [Bacteroidetes bacterium]|nr:MAG: hypothetical protein DRJ10_04675 [Bacteroidota bacterium]